MTADLAAQRHRDRTPEREIGHQAVKAVGRVADEHLSRPFPVDLGADGSRPIASQRARRSGARPLPARSRRPEPTRAVLGQQSDPGERRHRPAREVHGAVRARSRHDPGASWARRIASASRRRLTSRRCSDVDAQTAAAQVTNGRIRRRACSGRPSRMSSSDDDRDAHARGRNEDHEPVHDAGRLRARADGPSARERCTIKGCGGRRRHGEHCGEPAAPAREIRHGSDREEDRERPRRDPRCRTQPNNASLAPDADDHQHHHHACKLRREQPRRIEKEQRHCRGSAACGESATTLTLPR